MNGRRRFLRAVAVAAVSPSVAGASDEPGPAEVERLLGVVKASPCGFFRNGTRYSGHEAADHLRKKWQYATRGDAGAMNGAQFIAQVATVSSMTGQPYLVDCGRAAQPLASWLTAVLREPDRSP